MVQENWLLTIAAVVLGGVGLIWMFRRADRKFRRHMDSRVARVVAGPGGDFALRFTTAEAGRLVCYLRYQALVLGPEYHLGLRCQVVGQIGGWEAFKEDLGILGDISNPLPLEYGKRVCLEYYVRLVTSMEGAHRESTVLLGELAVGGNMEDIVVSGSITPNAKTRLEAAEIYLVPERMRL
jgi:hypothetical protein